MGVNCELTLSSTLPVVQECDERGAALVAVGAIAVWAVRREARGEIHYLLSHEEYSVEEREQLFVQIGRAAYFFGSSIVLSRIDEPANGVSHGPA